MIISAFLGTLPYYLSFQMCGYKTVVGMVNGMLEELNILLAVRDPKLNTVFEVSLHFILYLRHTYMYSNIFKQRFTK